jgi:hypothetical protein
MMRLACKGVRAPINSIKVLAYMFTNGKDESTLRDSVCFSVEEEQYHFRDIRKYGKGNYPERLDGRLTTEFPRVSPI